MTFIYLIVGLVLDVVVVALIARKISNMYNFAVFSDASIPAMRADGPAGHVHVRASEIVAWWREHALRSKSSADSASRKVIENAELVKERKTVAAMAEGSRMRASKISEVKYCTLHDVRRIYTNPEPATPSDFVNQRQEYPIQQRPVPCGQCDGTGKRSCVTCGGTITMRCAECYGSGRVECKNCKGSGRVVIQQTSKPYYENGILVHDRYPDTWDPCPVCHLEKTIQCEKCSGNGSLTCTDCAQSGKVDCDNCEGHGQVNRVEMEV